MKFLSCTIMHNSISKHFNSIDEAIGFIETKLNDTVCLRGSITVGALARETEFRFENQETMLESLMDL